MQKCTTACIQIRVRIGMNSKRRGGAVVGKTAATSKQEKAMKRSQKFACYVEYPKIPLSTYTTKWVISFYW